MVDSFPFSWQILVLLRVDLDWSSWDSELPRRWTSLHESPRQGESLQPRKVTPCRHPVAADLSHWNSGRNCFRKRHNSQRMGYH